MNYEQQKQLEASFKDFVSRPENAALALKAQQEEAQQALKLQEQTAFGAFLDQVTAAGLEVAHALEPFLRSRVLRRVCMSLANDPSQDLATWACNGQVQALLHHAMENLASGRMSEKELEHMLLTQLKSPANPHSAEFSRVARASVALPTEQLVSALNEHLSERRAAAAALRAGRSDEALQSSLRALSIMRLVRGTNADDQQQIDTNTVAALLDVAEAHLAAQQFGGAVDACSEALQLGGPCPRALLLRAKAQTWRREFKAAKADIHAAQSLDPEEVESQVEELTDLMQRLQRGDKLKDAQMCSRMFKA